MNHEKSSFLLAFIKGFDGTFDEAVKALESAPYHLKVRQLGSLYNFDYHQIKSPKNHPLVQQCRGKVIFRDHEFGNHRVVAWPMTRFFNYGEPHADEIDWSSAIIRTKEDGSLLKVYWVEELGEWHVGTRGTVSIHAPDGDENFRVLWDHCLNHNLINLDSLDKTKCYWFELVSPDNQIVVEYHQTMLIHLGSRCMQTLQELHLDEHSIEGIPQPKSFSLASLDDCVGLVKQFKAKKAEGVVVVDRYFRRIKVKSPDYVLAHHERSAKPLPLMHTILKVFFQGEKDEFLAVRPNDAEEFNKFERSWYQFIGNLEQIYHDCEKVCSSDNNMKEFSRLVNQRHDIPKDLLGLFFMRRRGKIGEFSKYFREDLAESYFSKKKVKWILEHLNL